jgi:hypothetical protein
MARARPHPTPPLLKLNLNPNVTPRLLLLPPPRSQLLWERARHCHRRRCCHWIRARRRRLGSRRCRCRPAVAGDAHAAGDAIVTRDAAVAGDAHATRRRRRHTSRRHRWRRRLAGSSPPVQPCGRSRPVSASLSLRPSIAGPRPARVALLLTGPLAIHLQAAWRPSLGRAEPRSPARPMWRGSALAGSRAPRGLVAPAGSSLSLPCVGMRLGTLQIGIHFLTGFCALVSRPRSFR